LGARSRVAEGMPGLRPHDDGDAEQVAAGMGFDLVEGAYDIRWFIRVLDGRAPARPPTSNDLGQPWRPLRHRAACLG